jgi:hypothetical protein
MTSEITEPSAGSAMPPAARPRRTARGEVSMVPEMTPVSYYGHPVIKAPVWQPEIGVYLFTGGLAGASAMLAAAARRQGNDELADRALYTALAGVSVSPLLLIKDLGVPRRFLNMLRVFKVTSPMSVGSWLLSAAGTGTGVAAGCRMLGILPRLQRLAETSAALTGPALATYTAVLIADTAVPVWHEARVTLPFVFAGSSLASAGAAGALLTSTSNAAMARTLAVAGVGLELAAVRTMESRLGELAEPYHSGAPEKFGKLAKTLGAAGAAGVALAGRRRPAAVAGGAAILAGAMCQRWSIFKAGFASAHDPAYTVAPQRARLREERRRRHQLS